MAKHFKQSEMSKNGVNSKQWIAKNDFILKIKCKCCKRIMFDILKTKMKWNGENCWKQTGP